MNIFISLKKRGKLINPKGAVINKITSELFNEWSEIENLRKLFFLLKEDKEYIIPTEYINDLKNYFESIYIDPNAHKERILSDSTKLQHSNIISKDKDAVRWIIERFG